ncbi:MAG TPA: 7-cyano-7-deazaguanine synthase [Gemmataceae bacterium]|nr:7-cyano-7-deazaguanine synthase [Gemmataceae bacterium]
MTNADHPFPSALAVLVSGGLDSAILLGEAVRTCTAVHPLYVRNGLSWERVELLHLRGFLGAISAPHLGPLTVLEMPVADLYGDHWSLTGRGVPGAETPDEAVFLPGRNVLLLSKAILWCHLHAVPAVALAPLESNPFPDATDAFFTAYQNVVNQAVGGSVRVLRPYLGLAKAEVMGRGRDLPLGLTFSCLRPAGGRHCGACNKCAERRRAFADAGMTDPTAYDREPA